MSNLGIRIIYSVLNNIKDVCCERFFSCAMDMERILRDKSMEIFSLESKRGLREFDIIGFSLGSELDYTNILNILELGNIPLKATLRGPDYPLVICGGPCTLNPEPLHDFFDLFIIGEAEDLILELIDVYREYKKEYKSLRLSKQDLLFKFCEIPGVYVPSFYEVRYAPSGRILEFKRKVKDAPLIIKKRFIQDLNVSPFPLDWLLPFIQIVHDRVTLEIMRGCPNRCRFCQGRSQYFPLRLRCAKNIIKLAHETYRRTGYEEISLGGLSVSDYAHVEELVGELIAAFKSEAVSVSLPSIKAKRGVGNLSAIIANVKKTGLTFAPEAGTEKLRNILAKDFDEGEFFKSLLEAYSAGYQRVKLYFMIGLPYEEKQDLDEIINFSKRVSQLRRKVKGIPAQINISINALIPKPHTPFQWFRMEDLESIKYKQGYLKNRVSNGRLILNFHSPYMSFLEGVLSRGDRRLSEVIFCAFKKGARFDAWNDYFSFEKWSDAFRESNVDPLFYLKQKTIDELLPWDFIDVGISKDELINEFNKTCNTKVIMS